MAEANTPVTETNQNMAENSGGDPTQPVSPQGEKGVSTYFFTHTPTWGAT